MCHIWLQLGAGLNCHLPPRTARSELAAGQAEVAMPCSKARGHQFWENRIPTGLGLVWASIPPPSPPHQVAALLVTRV